MKYRAACLFIVGVWTASCAETAEPTAPTSGFGQIDLALTGTFPGAAKLRVSVYQGAVTDAARAASFMPAVCEPYVDAGSGSPRNNLKITKLAPRKDYALLVELYSDDACTKLAYRAYRGGISVAAGSGDAVSANPYYVQPYALGKFSGLAQANPNLLAVAAQRACGSDLDCRSIHPNATCDTVKHSCTVDNLFPLNGAARRAFPVVVAMDDGRVAIAGGLTALISGNWQATVDRIEAFDPSTGLFKANLVSNAGVALGLSSGVSLAGNAFALVGGAASAKVALTPGTALSTALDTKGCLGAGTGCSISKIVARWDVKDAVAQAYSRDEALAFPIAARVRTKDGDRLLVAGGALVPLPASGDSRKGGSVLCRMDTAATDCSTAGPTMSTGRARAAVACFEGTDAICTKVLIFGGRQKQASALAEVYDATTNTFSDLTVNGALPAKVHGGQLLPLVNGKFILLGATKDALFLEDADIKAGGGIAPLLLTPSPDGKTLVASDADLGAFKGTDGGRRSLAVAISLADHSALLIGGLDDKLQPVADALWIGSDGKALGRVDLSGARFGGGAGRVGGKGPLAGCVLLAGGFTLQGKELQPQNHVEVFCPAAP